jgi:alkanesulfonate monooxygenase SsuD/methylene tetrahydromethanopterin reductase-like flavin-dependent oxidoreductase (luciferase family)
MKSSLLYSYQIEYRDGYRTFAESLAQMKLEQCGFDTVLISEHHLVDNGYFPAPFVTLGAAAMKTRKFRLGSGIILLPLYDPLHVAEHGAVLDVISNGRFTLGVGQGYRQEEFDAFKIPLKQRPGRTRDKGQYVGDLQLDGLLHMAVLRSLMPKPGSNLSTPTRPRRWLAWST